LNCQVHRREPWQHKRPVVRIRGRRLQKLRSQLFDRQPLCVRCLAENRVTVATIRDHVIPLGEGGADDEANVQPLCQRCSDAKSAQEAQRAQVRASQR
jgi:5-methylcytosine-specific restriction protein A